MARVASCPQCEHDLFVPEGTDTGAWATCPVCRAFFEIKDVKSRDVPAMLLVDSDMEAANRQTAPTLADLSSLATWTSEPHTDVPSEVVNQDPPSDSTSPAEDVPSYKPAGRETHEAAAERIDQWFRSAKTAADFPPVEIATADQGGSERIDSADRAAADAAIGLGDPKAGMAGFNSDLELEQPTELPPSAAPWDDSQHMERLLAGLQDQPIDTFHATGHDATPPDYDDRSEPASTWSPEEPLTMTSRSGESRRKRSLVRTMLVTVFGGVVGLALGYYALLWIRGPEIDFLDLAKYLPKSALPASFNSATTRSPEASSSNAVENLANLDAEPAAKTPDARPEKQAAFNQPVAPPKDTDDAIEHKPSPPAKDVAATHEPAVLEAPTAKALTGDASRETVHIANAPSFTTAELVAALQAARQAQPGLVNGNFSDGNDVKSTKGKSYMVLADLAQKATFAEQVAASPGIANTIQEIDAFFRQTLSNRHTAEELVQIVPMWIASPHRKSGGIFFAGSVSHIDVRGSMVEYRVELNGGPALIVLAPSTGGSISGPQRPVGVVGWIVDHPAEKIKGYTGEAPQAVFAKRLLSLE